MASYSQRGDQILAQVRKKEGGVLVFSESKLFPTQGEAETWAEALERRLKDDGVAVTAARGKMLGELILDHLKYLQGLRPLGASTIRNYKAMGKRFAGVKLSEMRAKHFLDFARERKEEGASPSTILKDLSPVSTAIEAAPYAHNIKVSTEEITLAMKKLADLGIVGRSKEIIRLVSQEEEDALLEHFRKRNQNYQTAVDMELMYHWALALPRRDAELCRMRWDDVDSKNRTVLIRDVKHPTKKIGNHQLVPLLPAAWELLKKTPKLGERILPFDPKTVSTVFSRARNAIAEGGLTSIHDLRFHDLRHTGITMLFWSGHPIQEVALVSGHTNWSTLKRYTHIKPEDLHRRYDPKAGVKKRLAAIENLTEEALQKARKETT